MSTNIAYLDAIRDCISCGQEVSPRGMLTHECIGHTVEIDMNSPIITIPERGLDYNFMVAEALWILSGEDKLNDFIRKNLEKYSDDGVTMNGAYGVPYVEQIDYMVYTLLKDPDSRQAVMTLWQRNPGPSKDIPCTVAMQFLLRDGYLHCCVFMRSNDVWLGLPYDIFSFSMMTLAVLIKLQATLSLGTLKITAGSRHLYARHLEVAGDLCVGGDCGDNLVINTHGFISPDDLKNELDMIRNAPSNKTLSTLRKILC